VINTNLPPVLQRFRDIDVDRSKSLYLATPVVFNSPNGGVFRGFRKIFPGCQRMAKVPNAVYFYIVCCCFLLLKNKFDLIWFDRNIPKNCNHLSTVHERYQQTNGRATAYSESEPEFMFAKNLLNSNISPMSSQYGELRPTSGWGQFVSLGHPSKFQRVSRLGFVTAATSLNGSQPNLARCLAVSIFGGSCPV